MPTDLSQDLASLRIERDRRPQARSRRKWLILLLALLGVAVLAVFAVRTASARLFKPVVSVGEVVALSPAQASVKVMASGYVVPQRKALVASKQPGRLEQVVVKEGQDVEAGQLLATMESDDVRASLNEARAALATAQAHTVGARASLADSKLQLGRETRLHQSGSSSTATVDSARSRFEVAEASLTAAEAEIQTAAARLANATVSLKNTRIVAPFAGRVVRKLAEAGEVPTGLYQSSAGGILELVDFSSLVVEADVSEGRIGSLKIGDPAEITLDAFPGKRMRGEVSEVRPTVDRQKATVLVRAKFLDPVPEVLPQMAGKVLILSKPLDLQELAQPLKTVVPASAVVDRGGGRAVFVLSEGNVHLVPVVVGDPVGSALELKQGPATGTRVVISPEASLRDGDAIKEKTNG